MPLRHALLLAPLSIALTFASPALAAPPTKQQCVDANESGQDLRQAGKLREAMQRFEVCAVSACPEVVRQDCTRRRDEAKSALAASATPATPVAPVTPVAPEPPPAVAKAEPAAKPADAPAEGSTQRIVSYALGGASVVALGVGAYFGLRAGGTYDDAMRECDTVVDGERQCSPSGLAQASSARGQALASSVLFTAGIALAAGAVVLYLMAPKDRAATSALWQNIALGRW